MKKSLSYLKDNTKERERSRFLNNFYTKKITNGKTVKADYLDKTFKSLGLLILLVFILNKLILNFIIALFISIIIMVTLIKNMISRNKRNRLKKIEVIKSEFRIELEKEKEITDDEDIEDYIVERYYEKKSELKSNVNLLGNDKIIKLYFLSVIFFLGSFLVKYSLYYKIIAIISFIMATLIGSYNLTEYIRKKEY